jgi:FkbM family methyltransferase
MSPAFEMMRASPRPSSRNESEPSSRRIDRSSGEFDRKAAGTGTSRRMNLRMLKWRLAQITFWLNRFRSLPRAKFLFGDVEPGTILDRSLFGYRFFCDVSRDGPQRMLFLEGERHIAEARLILKLLKPGFHVVDVGANIGYYVLLFKKGIGPDGRVVAIEPSPENLPELLLNVERNSLHKNVEIIEAAVGALTGTAGLQRGINSGVISDSSAAYAVRLDTLDNMIRDRVDFIKIDVEGFESFVLKGASRIISECRPILFVEIHPVEIKPHGISAVDVVRQLRQFYDNIELYEEPTKSSIFQVTLRRYFGAGLVRKVDDIEGYVSKVETKEVARPFWAVCRPEPSRG